MEAIIDSGVAFDQDCAITDLTMFVILFWLTDLEGCIQGGGQCMVQFTPCMLGSGDKGNAASHLVLSFHVFHSGQQQLETWYP